MMKKENKLLTLAGSELQHIIHLHDRINHSWNASAESRSERQMIVYTKN